MGFEETYKAAILTLIVLFWISVWLTYKLKIKPLKVERLSRKPRPDYLDLDTIKRILRLEEEEQIDAETCDWLNIIMRWVYAELLPIPKFRAKLEAFCEDMLLNFRRSRQIGSYVVDTKLIDVKPGSKPGIVESVKVITTPTEALPFTVLALNMSYSGGGGILGIARVDLIGGWQIFIRSRLCELAAPLYLIFRDNGDLFYGFDGIRDIKIRCQLVINGVQFRWLNWIVSRLLLPQYFRHKMCFPAMKAKFLVDPADLSKMEASINAEQIIVLDTDEQ